VHHSAGVGRLVEQCVTKWRQEFSAVHSMAALQGNSHPTGWYLPGLSLPVALCAGCASSFCATLIFLRCHNHSVLMRGSSNHCSRECCCARLSDMLCCCLRVRRHTSSSAVQACKPLSAFYNTVCVVWVVDVVHIRFWCTVPSIPHRYLSFMCHTKAAPSMAEQHGRGSCSGLLL
jgi:hypothetical protein